MKAKKDMESSKGTQKNKNEKRRRVITKGFGGKQRAKNLYYLAGRSCGVSQIIRPVIKNTRITRKTAFIVII